MKKALFAVLLVAGLAGLALGPARAAAGPAYVSSQPADGEEVAEAPDRVSVQFDQPLDPDQSALRVFDHCGKRVHGNDLVVLVNDMSVDLTRKPGGHYEVVYAAVGLKGVTGSTIGKFSFTVTSGSNPKCAGGHDHPIDKHGNHGDKKHGGHNKDHGRHEDMGHDSNDHGSMRDHTKDHSADHPAAGGGHGRHGRPNKHGEHNKHAKHGQSEPADQEPNATLASPDDLPGNLTADGGTVALALGLSMAFGVLGGWLLRVSSPSE